MKSTVTHIFSHIYFSFLSASQLSSCLFIFRCKNFLVRSVSKHVYMYVCMHVHTNTGLKDRTISRCIWSGFHGMWVILWRYYVNKRMSGFQFKMEDPDLTSSTLTLKSTATHSTISSDNNLKTGRARPSTSPKPERNHTEAGRKG